MTTALEQLADRFVDDYAAADPAVATYLGIPGHEHRWPDFSPAGHAGRADLLRATLAELDALAPTGHEELAAATMRERLSAELARHDAGLVLADLNSIESPLQVFRETFDSMATDTDDDWANVAARLAAVPAGLAGYLTSLRAADRTSAARQVRLTADRARRWAAADGPYDLLVAPVGADTPLGRELRTGVAATKQALLQFADAVTADLLPRAPEADAVGRERYAIESRWFTGGDLDLDEAYAWGQAELARIVAEKHEVAERIAPGAGVAGAMAALDADPARLIRGREALQHWLQSTADGAVEALAGVHFDIEGPLRRIEGRLIPVAGGGVYYSGPTEDGTRPGRMWWSLPDGVDEMTTWRETTTVFHEGVPGHHLQIGTVVLGGLPLNRWQRLLNFCSAHAEGWALYSERLMAELGFLDDDGDRLGWLDAAELRAARVVLDIGVHLQLPVPADEELGPTWTYEVAAEFLRRHVSMDDAMRTDELHRYLGWPGQAPVYKLGERVFLAGREAARARHGADFDLRGWHRDVLALGPLGLGPLATELARL